MKQYLDLVRKIRDTGKDHGDRTGTGTRSIFGEEMVFDLADGFPLLTTKKLHTKSIIGELLWFLQGRNDLAWLNARGIRIWDEWRKEDGTIGPGYGVMWRDWNNDYAEGRITNGWKPSMAPNTQGIDQMRELLKGLKENPFGRRHIVSAWNPAMLDKMALPPCHMFFQFHVESDEAGNPARLNLLMHQRSCDTFLGVPFNIASYALLLMIVAKEVGLAPGTFTHSLGDTHLYANHMEQVEEQLARTPRALPTLTILDREKDHPDDLFPNYEIEDFVITGYDPYPTIKAPISV